MVVVLEQDGGPGFLGIPHTITPSVTRTPSITATPSLTPSITTTPSITATPSLTPSITATPSLTATPSVTITPSITVTPSLTPSITRTPSFTPTPSPYPTAVTLTFTDYTKGIGNFNLGNKLTVPIAITSWSVIGFTNTSCTNPQASSDSQSGNINYAAGISGANFITGNTPMGCTIVRYKLVNSIQVSVNGGGSVSYTNGQTFTAGVATVTVSINFGTCFIYSC